MSIRLKPLLWQALVCVATATTAALLYLLFSASDPDEWTAPILGAHPVPARAAVVVAGAVFDGSVSQQARTRTSSAHDLAQERSENHSRRETLTGGAALEEPDELLPIGALLSAGVHAFDGVDPNDGRPQIREGLNPSPAPNPEPTPSEESPPATEPGGDSSSPSEAPVVPAESVDEPGSLGQRPEPSPAAEPAPDQPDQSDANAHETEHGSAYSGEPSHPPGDGAVLGTTKDDSLGASGDLTDLHSLFEQKLGKKRGKLHQLGINPKRWRERFKVSDRPEILFVSSALRDTRADRWPLTDADAESIDDDDAVTDDVKREHESDDRDRVDEQADGSDEHRVADSEDEFDDTHGETRDNENDEDS